MTKDRNMDRNIDSRPSVTVTLQFPVQLADRRLTEVTVRRPVLRDLIRHPLEPGDGAGNDLAFMGALTGLVREELEALDLVDYEALQTQVLRFRGAALTGDGAPDGPAAGASGGHGSR